MINKLYVSLFSLALAIAFHSVEAKNNNSGAENFPAHWTASWSVSEGRDVLARVTCEFDVEVVKERASVEPAYAVHLTMTDFESEDLGRKDQQAYESCLGKMCTVHFTRATVFMEQSEDLAFWKALLRTELVQDLSELVGLAFVFNGKDLKVNETQVITFDERSDEAGYDLIDGSVKWYDNEYTFTVREKTRDLVKVQVEQNLTSASDGFILLDRKTGFVRSLVATRGIPLLDLSQRVELHCAR